MGIQTTINGQVVELGTTSPDGLAVGSFSSHRKLIKWNIPNRGLVEMYINPQSLTITERKLIKPTRTKGGYVIQYWGNELPKVDISGTTGSSGIEGINVLRDIYNQEQESFNTIIQQLNLGFFNNLLQSTSNGLQALSNNPLASQVASTANALQNPDKLFNNVVSVVGNIANVFDNIGTAISSDQQLLPTLGALALSVELIYGEEHMRGFFNEFRADEKADELGNIRYTIGFTITRRTGRRTNYFPWSRTPSAGPANSDSIPLSFGGLVVPGTSVNVSPPPAITSQTSGVSRRNQLLGQ